MALRITTFSITTRSIIDSNLTLCINEIQNHKLTVIMLSVLFLFRFLIVILSVIMLNAIVLNAVAPYSHDHLPWNKKYYLILSLKGLLW